MSDQGPPPWEQDRPRDYPRQQLLPQTVRPRRGRTPLFVGIGLAIVLVVGGAVTYLALRDDGEDTRQAYCAALRDLTHDGDLIAAADGADTTTLDDLKAVQHLAPTTVSGDWSTLLSVAEKAQDGSPDWSQALTVFGALKEISSDAQSNCDLDLQLPML
jgi:hypothetical protein